jgi:hypothetical protein
MEEPMPASHKAMSKSKRLPVGFGPIDTQATWDSERFFTALGATGYDVSFLLLANGKLSFSFTDTFAFCPKNRTRLQAKRFADLVAWERNKDPGRHQQREYVQKLASYFRFEPRAESDGVDARFIHFKLN